MTEHESALAELDRIGRHAGAALRAAAQRATAPTIRPRPAGQAAADTPGPTDAPIRIEIAGNGAAPDRIERTSPGEVAGSIEIGGEGEVPRRGRRPAHAVDDAGATDRAAMVGRDGSRRPIEAADLGGGFRVGEPAVLDLESGGGRRATRTRRVLLVAAGLLAVGGLAAAQLLQSDPATHEVTGIGAPTAAIGDGPGGIYPPDAARRGYTVAGEGSEVWDQWNLDLPPVGQHLVVDLDRGDTRLTGVMGDLGSASLQVATLDSGEVVPGTHELAVYGVVDRATEQLVVERPGAQPIELDLDGLEGTGQQTTHDLFIGFLPADGATGAEVVARDAQGTELARVALPAPGDDAGDPEGSLFPDDPDHDDVTLTTGDGTGPSWSARVLDGGRYVTMGVLGNEDSATTVIERPGELPLQALATRLDGRTGNDPTVGVYGLVSADAASVELEVGSGLPPVPLDLQPIEGATHQAFVGWSPEVPDGAVVVARDAHDRVIERRLLTWTVHDAANLGG